MRHKQAKQAPGLFEIQELAHFCITLLIKAIFHSTVSIGILEVLLVFLFLFFLKLPPNYEKIQYSCKSAAILKVLV